MRTQTLELNGYTAEVFTNYGGEQIFICNPKGEQIYAHKFHLSTAREILERVVSENADRCTFCGQAEPEFIFDFCCEARREQIEQIGKETDALLNQCGLCGNFSPNSETHNSCADYEQGYELNPSYLPNTIDKQLESFGKGMPRF
jgi:hypothetical protein